MKGRSAHQTLVAFEVSVPLILIGISIVLVVKFYGHKIGLPVRQYPVYEDGWIYDINSEYNVREGRGTSHVV